MCGQISMSTTDPKPGDQVTFTCSAASGSSADLTNISYNFRVVEPDENEVLLTAQGNRSSIYTIPTGKYGTFVAECSLTDSSGNTPWPGQCEEHSQCQGISCASGAKLIAVEDNVFVRLSRQPHHRQHQMILLRFLHRPSSWVVPVLMDINANLLLLAH